MFSWFRKAEKPKNKGMYLVAYACDSKHCSARYNDGICWKCGETVRLAVCKGRHYSPLPRPLPYVDGFVRWLEDDCDATGLTRLRDEEE